MSTAILKLRAVDARGGHAPSGRGGGRRGFTLVEAAVSIVIVGVMFVAALTTVSSAAQGRRLQGEWRRGDGLARALMFEIAQQKYGSTTGTIVGTVIGGAITNRSAFTAIDEYHGLSESPPEGMDGRALVGYAGWKRTVTVERVDPASPMGGAVGSDKGLKRVTVTVRHKSGEQYSLTMLRSRWSPSDLSVTAGQSRMQGMLVHLRLSGTEGGDVYAGALSPNGPSLGPTNAVTVAGAGGGLVSEIQGTVTTVVGGVGGLVGGLLGGLLGGGK